MRVDQRLCLHLLLEEQLIGGPEVPLCEVVLGRSVTEEQVTLRAVLQVHCKR